MNTISLRVLSQTLEDHIFTDHTNSHLSPTREAARVKAEGYAMINGEEYHVSLHMDVPVGDALALPAGKTLDLIVTPGR